MKLADAVSPAPAGGKSGSFMETMAPTEETTVLDIEDDFGFGEHAAAARSISSRSSTLADADHRARPARGRTLPRAVARRGTFGATLLALPFEDGAFDTILERRDRARRRARGAAALRRRGAWRGARS